MKTHSINFKAIFALTVGAILSILSPASAATLTWDANAATASQTDGLGAWLTANQWWNGTSNVTWTSGDDAIFGNGSAGGAVTLASPTTIGSLTFNSFTGTYTLGTAGQTITLNSGITMNSGAGAATIISPITLGGAQSWLNNSSSLLTIGTGAVTNGGFLLTIGGTGNTTVSSVISGAGGLTKTGTGLLTLSGANTFAGQLTVQNGTLSINTINNDSANGTLGNNALSVILGNTGAQTGTLQYTGLTASSTKKFTLATSGTGAFEVTNSGQTLTLSGLIDGSGALTKLGAGRLLLSNSNTYTGLTTISAGILQLGVAGGATNTPLGTTAAGTVVSGTGAALDLNGFTLGTAEALTLNGTGIASGGALTNSTTTSTTYSGLVTLGSASSIVAPNAAGHIVLSNTGTITGSGFGLTLGGASTASRIDSIIGTGAGTLTKNGTGTWSLTGSNTYTGATILNAGNLTLSGTGTIATSTGLTFNGGGLTLTNTSAGEALIDRVSSSAIISNGGSITVTNTASGSTVYSETMGALDLRSGQLNVTQTNANTTPNQTLTFGSNSLTNVYGAARTAAATSAITFSGGSLGLNARNSIIVTSQSNTGVGTIIGPWATWGTSAAAQSDYATYNITNGSTNAFGIQNAAIAATADSTWTNSSNAYTNSTGGALTLAATAHNMLGLRNTGGTTVMTIPTGGNLNTYGLLNGVGTLWTVAATGTGALSTPAGGGNLFVTTGSGAITISAPIADNAGPVTLVAGGSSTLTLSSATNTYTGGTVINAGTVSINAAGQMPTAGPLTFAGSGTVLLNDTALTLPQTIINAGATATFDGGPGGSAPTTTMGAVSGGGTFIYTNAGGAGKTVTFSGGLADFTGVLQYSGAAGASYNVPSLADGAGRIRQAGAVGLTLNYTGASPLVLNNRQIELAGAGGLTFNTSGLLTINTDLLVTAAGNKTLSLSGPSTGTNAFNGTIGNGVGAAISLTLTNGIWSIAGTNTYTGATNVQAGTVIVNSLKDYGVASPFGLGTSGTAIGLGQSVSSATLIYTGTGDTSNRTFDLMQGASNNGNAIKQILNDGSGALILTAAAFNVNPVTAPHNLKTIQLGGTYSGSANEIQGVIQNLISGAGSPLIKAADPSIWKLSGANTYTGGTTVSGGTLVGAQTSGSPFSTGAVTLNAGTLSLAPTGSGSNVAVTGGTLAVGTLFTFNPGATLSLNKGSQTSLTYTFGGTGAAYSRGTNGTLILSTSDIANFGNAGSNSERFIINGTAPAVPLANGVLNGVVIQDRNSSNAGDFAAYNATNGFTKATYTASNFTGSSNTSVLDINGVNTSGATPVYAMRVTGTVTNTGNTITLGNSTNPAALILNSGTITAGTLASAAAGAEFLVYTTGTSAISSAITTSTSGMSVFGPGTLTLSNTNTFTGGLRINNSTVIASADNQLGGSTAAITLTGGTLQTSGTFALGGAAQRAITLAQTGGTFNVSSGTTTYQNGSTNIISGSGSLTKTGAGTLALTGITTNTYTGGTFVNVGTLQLGASNMLADTGAVTVNGGTFDIQTFTDTLGTVTLTSGNISGTSGVLTGSSFIMQGGTASAILGGSGSLTKTTSGTTTLSGSNTYNGRTTVSAGILSLTNPLALQNSVLDTSASIAGDASNGLSTTQTALTIGGLTGNKNFAATGGVFTTTGGYGSVTALTLNPSGSVTYSGGIADGQAPMTLTKTGSGTQILSGTNSYTGATTVSVGTLQFANMAALYGGTTGSWTAANINVKSGATLALNLDSAGTAGFDSTSLSTLLGNISVANTAAEGLQAGAILALDTSTATYSTFTQGNAIANSTGGSGGAVSVTKLGGGVLVFDKANTYTGATTVSAGVLYLTGSLTGTAIATTGTGILSEGVAGVIGGAASFTQGSTGMSTLSGTNTYTGATTISAGTLQIGSGSTTGSLSPSSAITNNATLVFNRSDTLTQGTDFASVISGGGAVTQAGTGTLVLSGTNTFRGQLTVSAGTLSIGSINNKVTDGTLGNGGVVNLGVSGTTGTLLYTGASAGSNMGFRLNGVAGTFNVSTGASNLTLSGLINGSGNLIKLGAGTLTLSGTNVFSGTTTVTAGTLALGNSLALQNSVLDTTNSVAGDASNGLSTTQTALTIGGLTGNKNFAATGGVFATGGYSSVSALTLNPSGSVSYSGIIDNGATGMSLTKTGAGTQVLQGVNTYSGATTISEGTLTLSGSGSINSSSGIVIQGGTLTSTSTTTGTTPFGANNINFNNGTLSLVPASAGAYAFTGANAAAGSTFTYSGGANLVLTRNGANTLSYTIGNAGATANSVLARSGNGTLVVQPTALANLGGSAAGSENFIINQQTTDSNMNGASTATGIYSASAVGMASNVGTFLSYGTGAGGLSAGFAQASYTTAVAASTIAANTISDVTSNIAINDTSNPYALRVGAFTLTNSGTTTVNGGAASGTNSGLGGVILNSTATASTITGGTLAFGSSEGMIFAASSGAGNGTIASKISGSAGITKFGIGTLVLSSTTSDFTGGIRINQGTLSISADTNLGNTGNGITFNGIGTLTMTTAVTSARSITVNSGAVGRIQTPPGSATFSGNLTGDGTLVVSAGNDQRLIMTGAGSFTGPVWVQNSQSTANRDGLVVNNASLLADSAAVIRLGGGSTNLGGMFVYGGSSPLTFNNRWLEFNAGTAGQVYTIVSDNATAANALTFNRPIVVSATAAGTVVLAGRNTGLNAIAAGGITDGANGAAIGLTLSAAAYAGGGSGGNWYIGGTNTYSGATNVSSGSLTFRGKAALPSASAITIADSTTLRLLDDGTGVVAYGNNFVMSNRLPAILFVGNNSTANGGDNPSSTTTNSVISLGVFNASTATNPGGGVNWGLNITGTNGYSVRFAGMTLNTTAGDPNNSALTLNPTTASVEIAGTIQQRNGRASGGATAFVLDGTSASNVISGVIIDAADFTNGSNVNAVGLGVTKANTSTWTLSGTNTYTGTTTLSGGTLSINSIGNVNGGSSALGNPSSAANGTIAIGSTTTAATLVYTGSAATTDRVINLAGTTGGATLDQSGSGLLKFTSALTATGAGSKTLTLQGSTNGTGEIAAAIVDNSGTHKTSVVKGGTGAWTLSGTNTNTGTTTINGGTLQFAKQVSLYNNTTASWSAANINVKSGGTLAFNVGGTGEFTTGDFTTLLTNLAASSSATNGMNGGSNFGFDTTNASGGTFTIADVIANSTGTSGGARGLTKLGTNTLILTNTNTYTGATTINAGKLLVHGSTAAGSAFTVNSGATLGGSGTINGTVTLMSGATLSPGASIESLGLGSSAWNGGSTVQIEFSTDGSTGAAGTEWDLLAITGTLDLTGASSSTPVILDLVSMVNATTAGALAVWDENVNATWAGFVTTTGGFAGFSADKFSFLTSNFANTLNGTFSVSQNGNNLDLNYMTNYVIPEPKAALLGGLGILLLLRRRR